MKVVFNTKHPFAAASMFYNQAFTTIGEMDFYNRNFDAYDVALFMTYDHSEIEGVKKSFPHLKIGVIDPRSPAVLDSTPYCDFIIVDSIEMEDFWRGARKPIFKYVEYPRLSFGQEQREYIKEKKKILFDRDPGKIYIGYHGNSYHLMEGAETIAPALSDLSKKYDIELLLMHNDPPGGHVEKYHQSLPKGIKQTRVPWSMENYENFLALSDIGIVPNSLGLVPESPGITGDPNTDYCLSFKMTSNPGRFIVFGLLGIPVVADFYPSSLQYLQNGRGFVAHSEAGWYHCLEQLITSHTLRQQMGSSLQDLVKKEFDFEIQNKKLVSFLKLINKGGSCV
jgi:glycosyltransferase involved in cell wall biosynthesis